jgi:hypothetical protein
MNTTQKIWYIVTATYANGGNTTQWKTRSPVQAAKLRKIAIKSGGAMYSKVEITESK